MSHKISNNGVGTRFDVKDGHFEGLVVFHDDMITVRASNSPNAHAFIKGEDLHAFRELLNAIPEEAFVVPEPDYSNHVSAKDADGDWWIHNGEGWKLTAYANGRSPQGAYAADVGYEGPVDEFVKVARQALFEEPKPFWSDGDVVAYDGETVRSIFERQKNTWIRISTTVPNMPLGAHCGATDDGLEQAVKGESYSVLRRANA